MQLNFNESQISRLKQAAETIGIETNNHDHYADRYAEWFVQLIVKITEHTTLPLLLSPK